MFLLTFLFVLSWQQCTESANYLSNFYFWVNYFYWGLTWTLLLPRLLCLTPQWLLTVCLSWSVWLTVCCAADPCFLLAMLDWWWTRPAHCFSSIHNTWYLLISHSWILSFVHLWWFVASRWEYHHWHHPIGPFLWEEREGRAYIWWLLQVLKNNSGWHELCANAQTNHHIVKCFFFKSLISLPWCFQVYG